MPRAPNDDDDDDEEDEEDEDQHDQPPVIREPEEDEYSEARLSPRTGAGRLEGS
jgi:hypothetical protein